MSERIETRQHVIDATKEVLGQMTRRKNGEIELEDNLSKDLELDSMDAVDLVVDMKMKTGVKFGQEDVKEIETVSDIVDAACEKLSIS